jgi:tRNA-2-methylthio-N6-dimethylallyladenosine synthase
MERYQELVRSHFGDSGRKACVITFGCQQNEADSEKIRGLARNMGYVIADEPSEADLIVVNTCAIRKHAELKALSVIGRFKEYKKNNPDLTVGVVGCMAAEPHIADFIKHKFRHVSFTLEPNMLHLLPELIWKSISQKNRSFIFGMDEGNIVEGIEPVRASGHKAWVSVMYGCNNFCSYCIVPYVRGRERSRDSKDVIDECKQLIEGGCREITLLGQNVNSYKSDMDFASLLESIAKIPGDFVLRFMTSHPKDVSDRLIEVMGKYTGKVAPHFHLPLQSGSDSILKAMNRTYNTEKFLSTVDKLRASVDGIALTSDIIVGFPGETESDFQDTLAILSKVRFDMVYSFIYSPREGTRAAKMVNQISDEVKGDRMNRLLELQCEISLEKNLPYVDRVERVLVDSFAKNKNENTYTGRTLSNKLVQIESDENFIGQFKNVKIKRTSGFCLFGEYVKE